MAPGRPRRLSQSKRASGRARTRRTRLSRAAPLWDEPVGTLCLVAPMATVSSSATAAGTSPAVARCSVAPVMMTMLLPSSQGVTQDLSTRSYTSSVAWPQTSVSSPRSSCSSQPPPASYRIALRSVCSCAPTRVRRCARSTPRRSHTSSIVVSALSCRHTLSEWRGEGPRLRMVFVVPSGLCTIRFARPHAWASSEERASFAASRASRSSCRSALLSFTTANPLS